MFLGLGLIKYHLKYDQKHVLKLNLIKYHQKYDQKHVFKA